VGTEVVRASARITFSEKILLPVHLSREITDENMGLVRVFPLMEIHQDDIKGGPAGDLRVALF